MYLYFTFFSDTVFTVENSCKWGQLAEYVLHMNVECLIVNTDTLSCKISFLVWIDPYPPADVNKGLCQYLKIVSASGSILLAVY